MRLLTLLVLFYSPAPLYTADLSGVFNRGVAVETFETDALLAFPQGWSALKDAQEARGIYRVAEEDGNRFLRAHAEKQGIMIALSGEQQIERHQLRTEAFHQLQCLVAVEGSRHPIASLFQVVTDEVRNAEFIFNDENAFHRMRPPEKIVWQRRFSGVWRTGENCVN